LRSVCRPTSSPLPGALSVWVAVVGAAGFEQTPVGRGFRPVLRLASLVRQVLTCGEVDLWRETGPTTYHLPPTTAERRPLNGSGCGSGTCNERGLCNRRRVGVSSGSRRGGRRRLHTHPPRCRGGPGTSCTRLGLAP